MAYLFGFQVHISLPMSRYSPIHMHTDYCLLSLKGGGGGPRQFFLEFQI